MGKGLYPHSWTTFLSKQDGGGLAVVLLQLQSSCFSSTSHNTTILMLYRGMRKRDQFDGHCLVLVSLANREPVESQRCGPSIPVACSECDLAAFKAGHAYIDC